MRFDRLNRRHFLQGLGATLALPLLPSLFKNEALAQTIPVQKTFVGILAQNGLYRMYGPQSLLMPRLPFDYPTYKTKGLTTLAVPGRHDVHAGDLSAMASANGGAISDIIDADFTPLLPKMMMLQGMDYLSLAYCHHHAQFGNADDQNSNATSGNPPMASIDRVLGYSSSFYKNPMQVGRAVCFTANQSEGSSGYQGSSTWQDPTQPNSSPIVFTNPVYANPATLFDAFFMTNTQSQAPLRKTLVDQVFADYKALRSNNSRLGAADKQKLDLHLQFIQQTQQKVSALAPVCSQMRPASNLTDRAIILTTMNDVIASLAACGLCNSFLGWAQSLVSSDPEDYHKWSHQGYDNDNDAVADQVAYDNLVENNRGIMKDIALDLAKKLDANHLLDDSFVVVANEHNKRGHESWNTPVITFGSAGGTFKTGQYLDYRNMDDRDDLVFSRFGFPMNQFLANTLRAMDVPVAEFEALNLGSGGPFKANSGYGVSHLNPQDGGVFEQHYDSRWNNVDLSDWLPGIKA